MYTGYERFPRPAPRVQPLITFGKPKSKFQDPLTDAKSDMLHAQYRLSLLQWNAGAARRQPTQLITVMFGAFHAVLLQEAADHIPHITKQFHTYTNGDNLTILLNRDTFLPGAARFPISEETTSKTTWVSRRWWYVGTYADLRSEAPSQSHYVQYMYTTLLLRSVRQPPHSCNFCMRT